MMPEKNSGEVAKFFVLLLDKNVHWSKNHGNAIALMNGVTKKNANREIDVPGSE